MSINAWIAVQNSKPYVRLRMPIAKFIVQNAHQHKLIVSLPPVFPRLQAVRRHRTRADAGVVQGVPALPADISPSRPGKSYE